MKPYACGIILDGKPCIYEADTPEELSQHVHLTGAHPPEPARPEPRQAEAPPSKSVWPQCRVHGDIVPGAEHPHKDCQPPQDNGTTDDLPPVKSVRADITLRLVTGIHTSRYLDDPKDDDLRLTIPHGGGLSPLLRLGATLTIEIQAERA